MSMLSLSRSLQQIFGFEQFRPGQKQVIAKLMSGSPVLAVFPTGGGKSLCYQLPALHFEGLTVVVSPLIALMKDQIDFLQEKGVRAARLDSSLSAATVREVWQGLRNGGLKLLYVAPERFKSERFLERMKQCRISLLVIDEAHCICEWGHNFRPDYLKLAQIAGDLRVERILALTATATPGVAADICRSFSIGDDAYINTSLYRSNLELRVTPCRADERDDLLVQRIGQRPRGATIVYVCLQKTAEKVADFLRQHGQEAQAYHAGMKAERRTEVQNWFMAERDAIVVATIAFGMGIDKADIRYIYHYNLPKGPENYAQEIGRAGRDDEPSVCEVFACRDDTVTLENFTYGDTPTATAVGNLVRELLAQKETFDVSLYDLARRHDIRQLVVSTLLCYLELDGYILPTSPFYNAYKFKPRSPSAQILANFDPQRRQFLHALFCCAKKGRTWLSIDIDKAAKKLQAPRERLVAALNYLEEMGHLALQVSELRQGYRIVQRPADVDDLVKALVNRFFEAENRAVKRIAEILDFVCHESCLVRNLLDYFGEKLKRDCGHCSRCLGEPYRPLPPVVIPPLGASESDLVKAIHGEGHQALAEPRQMTRFLCGLSSPALTATRPSLTRHQHFGIFGDVPFAQVHEFVEGILLEKPND